MFRLRSVSSIVIAPARAGSDSNSNRTLMAVDHTNSVIRSGFILWLSFQASVMKINLLYSNFSIVFGFADGVKSFAFQ